MRLLIILIVAAFIAGVMVFEASSMRKDKKRRDRNEVLRALGSTDVLIGRYNRCLNEFKVIQEDVQSRIEKTKDLTALQKANAIIEEFDVSRKQVHDYLDGIDPDVITLAEIMARNDSADVQLCNMEDAVKMLQKVRPVKKEPEEHLFDYSQMVNDTRTYFSGCKSKDDVRARYKALVKAFHPDGGHGDADTLIKVKEEYERELQKFA